MTTHSPRILALAASFMLCGCTMWMRDSDYYATELAEQLEGRSEVIAACYDRFLAEHDPKAKGELVVEFDIAKKTGELGNVEIESSAVPEPLARCVTDELATMRMDPPDAKDAHATITWDFTLGSRKKPPADPFVEAQTVLLGCYERHLGEVDREAKGDLVIDYAFDRASGAVERLDVVEGATTAPPGVVECAKPAFSGAKLEPDKLDDRNAAGRRTFVLRFDPYVAEAAADKSATATQPEDAD